MPTKKHPQNVLPLSPAVVHSRQTRIECTDLVVRMELDGVMVKADLDVVETTPDTSLLTLKVKAFLPEIPDTDLHGMEAWLVDLLRRTFAPKDACPAA